MGKRLEEIGDIEIRAKKCHCRQCKQTLLIISEVHRLRGAIEKHRDEHYEHGWWQDVDNELYKALKEEE